MEIYEQRPKIEGIIEGDVVLSPPCQFTMLGGLFKKVMIKVILETDGFLKEVTNPSYEKKREELRKLINSNPLVVNREVFKKTKEEKELVNKLKRRWKSKTKI